MIAFGRISQGLGLKVDVLLERGCKRFEVSRRFCGLVWSDTTRGGVGQIDVGP